MNQVRQSKFQPTRKKPSWLKWLAIGLAGSCLLVGLTANLFNVGFPPPPEPAQTLSAPQIALLDEVTHLRQLLGDTVFPGWGKMDIPIVVYNEQYAFLIGMDNPPPGWVMIPREHRRGGDWEPISSADGQLYYRTAIEDAGKTPENFVVQVGGEIAASFQTHNFALSNLHGMMYAELPPLLRDIFPYRLFFRDLVLLPEAYLSGLAHESFHVYQARTNPSAFERAELSISLDKTYPFDDQSFISAWKEELKILSQAAGLTNREEARQLAIEFLAMRENRRSATNLSRNHVMLERQREWLEGMAKYAELELGRQAAITDFKPLAETSQVADLHNYSTRAAFWKIQLESIDTNHFDGETLFYYSGFAQAVILDQLLPGWKTRAIEGESLEDLIADGIKE